MSDTRNHTRHIMEMLQRQEVNLIARAAQQLKCSEWDIILQLPPEYARLARTDCLAELWNELATWQNVGVIMCHPGFSLESRGQLAPLTERGGMWHFYGTELAGHIDLKFVCGAAFCSLPVRGRESHSVRFFGQDGSHMVSIYAERDESGQLTERGVLAYRQLREHFAVPESGR